MLLPWDSQFIQSPACQKHWIRHAQHIEVSIHTCSHEIKRHLLLGRKAMTNLDSILKNRDITWLTKLRLVKAMVFPVLSAEELMLLNCGVGEDS